jgi:uncharacterized protein (DUF1778 family)
MTARTTRSQKLDLRLSQDAKQTLRAAAAVKRRTVSDFVLESALERAEETLADRTHFGLDAEHWAAFKAALDTPLRSHPRLRKLLTTPGVFDQK